MGDYRNLKVWIRSKELAVRIYNISNNGEISRNFGLRDQMRRSAISIPSNIAEGDALDTIKQSIKHFYIARGSLAELRTQLQISHEIKILSDEIFSSLDQECDEIASMITSLIKHRSKKIISNKNQ